MEEKEFIDNKIEINLFEDDEELDSDDKIDELKPVGFFNEQSDNNKQEKKKRKPSYYIYNVVRVFAFFAAGVAFAYASYNLMDSYLDYKAANEKYSEIDNMFIQNQEVPAQEVAGGESEGSAEYQGTLTKWVWDYKAMLKYNDEAKGYIKLPGSRIQYPILQHKDNDYYLVRGSDKVSNGGGAIFLDSRSGGLDAGMSVLYGHNMLDGSMFADLMKFSDTKFCKKNQTFDIYVGNRHYIYYVFASFRAKADDENIYKFGFEDNEDFSKWINKVYSKSNYEYSCDKPDINDKIIMCSTCVDNYGTRMVVCIYRGEEVVD